MLTFLFLVKSSLVLPGYLIAQGVFDMHTTMVVGILAGIVGSIVSYWMGEHGGRPLLLKYGKYIFSLMNINLNSQKSCLISMAV